MNTIPSGAQYEISRGDQRATAVEVGGGIRDYRVGGRPVLDGYPVTEMCGGARGTPLIPWPNRLADGRYRFRGVSYQLPITEPESGNAIHGLTRWHNWSPREIARDRVVLGHVLVPQPGYPFTLQLSITYQLDEHGLTVAGTATNLGDRACPYGHGQHPYLTVGTEFIDDCELRLDAAQVLLVDGRGLPTTTDDVTGGPFDFRSGRRIGDAVIDNAYTALARDSRGLAWATLTSPDGSSARLWVDEHYRYLEIYTGDTQPPARRRRGLGVEPMTCAPNGLASGDGLIVLEPGQTLTTRWGIQPRIPHPPRPAD